MRPATVQTVISAPREDVIDLICDLSRRPAWTDHYTLDYRLARVDSFGEGAAARFMIKPPRQPHLYVELTIAEVARPRRVVETGRVGRIGRTTLHSVYDLTDIGPATRVELTTWTEPGTRWDAVKEAFGTRRWLRRKSAKSLVRLRRIFEEPGGDPLARVSIAGYEPHKNPRFGASPEYTQR